MHACAHGMLRPMSSLLAAAIVLALSLHEAAAAQPASDSANYPTRPVRIVAGWAAGGGSDVLARLVTSQLSTSLGQQMIIDNRVGAAHTIASDIVARAPANGYTLQLINANHTLNPFIYQKLPYDTERDFAPVSQLTRNTLVLLVNAAVPVSNVKELIALAHAKPDTLAAATAGVAGTGAVTTEVLKRLSGIPFIIVPYKSGGPAMVAVMQGESQIMIATQSTAMGFIKSGKVKVLAAASKKRLPLFDDVPTFQEAGLPALELGPWDGLVAPAKTPPAIIDLIHRHVVKALTQPEVASALASHGFEIVGSTPAEFSEHIRQELAMLRQVFKGGVWKLSAAYPSRSGAI